MFRPSHSAKHETDEKLCFQVEDTVRCYNMDGRHFFRQAVQELYDSPFPARKGPRMSANKAAKLARHEREQKKQKLNGADSATESSSLTSTPSEKIQPAQESFPGRFVEHCIMNLPASAIDMLDAFQGLYTSFLERSEAQRSAFLKDLEEYSKRKSEVEWNGALRLPMVHCYCFTKEVEDHEPDICKVSSLTSVCRHLACFVLTR